MPASFKDQLVVVEELLREVERMESGERRFSARRSPGGYERELRRAGLGDRAPVTGEDWHKALIARCSQPFAEPPRPAVVSPPLAADLLELCEFRHVVRNIYPTRLDEAKVRENLQRLIRAARTFGEACEVFAAGLAPARKHGRTRRSPRG